VGRLEHSARRCESSLKYRLARIWLLLMLFLAVSGFMRPRAASPQEKVKVAVLPFRVYAMAPQEYLKRGLQEMLTVRMEKLGFHLISPEVVNKQPRVFAPNLETQDLIKIGEELGVEWVVYGSMTQIGKKISLDLRVVDVSGRRPPVLVYMVAENMDELPPTMERIAASVDNQISGVAQVEEVRVSGNQRIEKAAILAVVSTKKGQRLNYDRLDKDLRDIYKMGFFKDVEIETESGPSGVIVTFNVTEKPSIGKIVFHGNKDVSEEDLKKEAGIKLYSILDQNEIKQSMNRLKEFYRQKGFYNVEISDRVEPLPNNEVTLKYEILEHEKVYITKIEFEGNTKFTASQLKGIMETGEKGWLSWITDSGYLDRKKLEFDVFKLTSFYQNHGYIKAVVGEPKVTYIKGEGLKVTIEINEGHQYLVNKVSVEGDLIKPADELLKASQVRSDEVFNRELVRKDVLALKDVYADDGFAYAEVKPLIKEDNKKHLVDITYDISKGEKVRFERINISGNTVTRDKVIRRELKVVEGEYFSAKALQRSTQNLHRLGYFENVEVQTKKGTVENQMILNVNVKEKPTGSFSFGGGYSSADNVVGMVQIAQDNLFGRGERLSAAVRIGGISSQFDVRFTEPWLFERPISADVVAYKWMREFDDYTNDSLGGSLAIGFPLEMIDDYTRGVVRYTYDDADITDVARDAAYSIKEMEGINITSSVSFGVSRNSTDRAWNPSRGSLNAFNVEYAGGILGGTNAFTKYDGRSAWFFPLPWETVFMVQGRWGYIQQNSGGNLPVYEKFFLGGINTVRGFDYAEISPRDPITGDKIGGDKMMVYNLEYRFPLIKEQGIIGLVFFDAGNVFGYGEGPGEDFTFSGIRTSVGGGVRWYSPMGPLRLEWGYNLDPQYNEAQSKFDFTIGTVF
jgi:outer membrane protein insertion porin family